MADKNRKARLELLNEFHAAPNDALFPQVYIAALLDCSTANVERARWQGWGVPFLKIGHRIFYRKSDYLAWEERHKPVRSTAEAAAQTMRLRREALSDAPSSAASAERHKSTQSTAEADVQATQLRKAALSDADRIATGGEG
jgi:hypothetical protein